LSTSGGSINLSGLNGNIEAATSGGSINGNDIAGELSTFRRKHRVNDLSCSLETSTKRWQCIYEKLLQVYQDQ